MSKVSTPVSGLSKVTGFAAVGSLSGSTAVKTLGIRAVKHFGGKWIATRGGAYVAGTLGASAAAVALAPMATIGICVATAVLAGSAVLAKSRGH